MVLPRRALETAASIISSAKRRVAWSRISVASRMAAASSSCLTFFKYVAGRVDDRSVRRLVKQRPRRALRRALDRGKNRLRFVARLDQQALGKVRLGVVEGVEDHALDLLVRQSISRLHFDLRRLPAALLARA